MKKRVLISLATAALLGVGAIGAAGNNGVSTPRTVQAAKKGYKIQLKHNAYVFNKRGKRKGRKTLKKGKTIKAYRKIKIKGKKFYQLTKGRYVKAANANKAAASSKNDAVTLIKKAQVYDAQGRPTSIVLKKGLIERAHGTVKIKGKQYYAIGGNHYILTDTAKVISSNRTPNHDPNQMSSDVKEPEKDKANEDAINDSEKGEGIAKHQEKPTKSEIAHLLANNNDKLGYSIYFSDDELNQIKNYLWQDIQNYRLGKGLPKYKSSKEINDFLAKVTSSKTNMYLYEGHLNETTAGQLATYLPVLAESGMNISDSFDDLNYYGHSLEGYEQPKSFNFKDRNPEHVATQIFDSFKDDSFYNKMILGHNDKMAFAGIALYYNWEGNYSTVGIAFIEVSGNSPKWTNYYNEN